MKLSLVTATYNCKDDIDGCISSVVSQSYRNIEHIVIDGASTDGTLLELNKYKNSISVLISEPDAGIYDALNKGFKIASGDVVGILHSDDRFNDPEVLSEVMRRFEENSCLDYVYGDIEMVKLNGSVGRYWSSGDLIGRHITSSQIPHPALFLSARLVKKIHPIFDSSYEIAADLKQQLFFVNVLHARGSYIKRPLVRMRLGGKSNANLFSYIKGWGESRRAWNEIHGRGGLLYVFKKVFVKIAGLRLW